MSAGYGSTSRIHWNAGVSNVFNVFPDRNRYGGTFSGMSPSGRSTSQFGLMGRFIYSGLAYTF